MLEVFVTNTLIGIFLLLWENDFIHIFDTIENVFNQVEPIFVLIYRENGS